MALGDQMRRVLTPREIGEHLARWGGEAAPLEEMPARHRASAPPASQQTAWSAGPLEGAEGRGSTTSRANPPAETP